MRTLRIRYKNCSNKLAFVRLVRDCTLLGLKESKDIADKIWNNQLVIAEINLAENYIREGKLFETYKEFTTNINSIGEFEVSGGLEWERDLKMLRLGIGNIEDYVNFASDYMSYNNTEENKIILQALLNKLKKEDLVELVNQIKA